MSQKFCPGEAFLAAPRSTSGKPQKKQNYPPGELAREMIIWFLLAG